MERINDDFFSSVIDAAPDGLLIVDAEGVITLANQQASKLFGIPHDELLGTSVDNLVPEGLRSGHRSHRLRYRAEPRVRPMGLDLMLRARRGDGTVFPVEVSLSPLPEADGFHVVVAVRDVTARVDAEDSMRRVLLTLDATEDAVFIMDSESLRFSYVNDGASRQVGYARDELVGMTPMHINPDLSESDLRRAIDDVQSDGRTAVSLRTIHRHKDGTDVPVEMSLQAAPDNQDGTVSIIAVARDISPRLVAEEHVRRSEQAMRDAERVVAVADDRERIARDLHDTVIQRLFASGLQLQAVMARVDEEVAGRLDSLIGDLDQTIREIRTAIFALHASDPAESGLRGKILDVVRAATDALGFEPRLQFEGPIETMDHRVAEQMLPTLREALTNVAKHAGAKSVRVIVDTSAASAVVTLTVLDDGVGVPADVVGGDGLKNMRTRAVRLGGAVRIEGGQPSGTRLVWSVPSEPPVGDDGGHSASGPLTDSSFN